MKPNVQLSLELEIQVCKICNENKHDGTIRNYKNLQYTIIRNYGFPDSQKEN